MKQLTFLILFLFAFGFASAQLPTFNMMMAPDSTSTLEFGFRKPNFTTAEDFSFLSGNYTLRYQHVINDRFNALASLNYVSISAEGESLSSLGNIYLGAQYKFIPTATRSSSIDFGLFLPTADFEALFGVYTDVYNLASYFDIDLGINASYRSFTKMESGFRYSYELGLDYFIGGDEFDGDGSELFARYGLSAGYDFGDVFFNAEFLGVYIITEEDNFNDNSVHSISGGFGYDGGKFIPSVFYKRLLDDDLSDFVDYTIGIMLSYNIE